MSYTREVGITFSPQRSWSDCIQSFNRVLLNWHRRSIPTFGPVVTCHGNGYLCENMLKFQDISLNPVLTADQVSGCVVVEQTCQPFQTITILFCYVLRRMTWFIVWYLFKSQLSATIYFQFMASNELTALPSTSFICSFLIRSLGARLPDLAVSHPPSHHRKVLTCNQYFSTSSAFTSRLFHLCQ